MMIPIFCTNKVDGQTISLVYHHQKILEIDMEIIDKEDNKKWMKFYEAIHETYFK